MNSELVMNNYLLLLKATTEVYVHGTLESSNENVRNVLKESLNDILSFQANTYDIMTQKNWYSVENIQNNQINETISKLNNN